jgi:hypothetical protein
MDQPSEPSPSEIAEVPDDEVDLGSRSPTKKDSGPSSPRTSTKPADKDVPVEGMEKLAVTSTSTVNGQSSPPKGQGNDSQSTSPTKSKAESGTRSVAEPVINHVSLARHAKFKPVLEAANVDMGWFNDLIILFWSTLNLERFVNNRRPPKNLLVRHPRGNPAHVLANPNGLPAL